MVQVCPSMFCLLVSLLLQEKHTDSRLEHETCLEYLNFLKKHLPHLVVFPTLLQIPTKLKKNQLRHQSWSAGINQMMTMEFQYSDIDCIWMTELEETFE